jgi:hypothetical protein
VPHVDITAELVCMWFDHYYHPDRAGFISCFTPEMIFHPVKTLVGQVKLLCLRSTTSGAVNPWSATGSLRTFAGTGGTFVDSTYTNSAARTNSTFGYGAGLVACDGNFIYVSTGTNAWRRVALGAGGW